MWNGLTMLDVTKKFDSVVEQTGELTDVCVLGRSKMSYLDYACYAISNDEFFSPTRPFLKSNFRSCFFPTYFLNSFLS